MTQAVCVYILECSDGTLYTGWTNDIEGRVKAHNAGTGAKYTRGRLPVKLVYTEEVAERGLALRRERQIKQMTRAEKRALIAGTTADS
ncbi:MAG: GIY-YIG nuclease family protein [Oscillospiraceae bacterium]|jgi:putative endonuclease|nr:GIY-YIG nuclease family protein [Oscillospiraceae bacterium]